MGRILEKFSKPYHQEAVRTIFEYEVFGHLLKEKI